jgi:putative hydrolase
MQDTNMTVAGLLGDLAVIQESKQREFGYKQAAGAIRRLDEPVEHLRRSGGSLRRVPRIGPASTRVILEVLDTGTSATVETAVATSPRAGEVARRRQWRANFLSRARVRMVLRDPALGGPAWDDYRGDLQMHSTWSDGSQTLEDIVATGLARGYAFAAVTDHANLPIANGLTPERFARQLAEIDALRPQVPPGFRLLTGVEANIRADGGIDLDAPALRRFDVVVAAPHSKLRVEDDQTARLLAAVRTPGVHILGHPRGRMYGSRPGITADWGLVFAEAARRGRRDRRRSLPAGSRLRAGAAGGVGRLSVRARQRRPRRARVVVRRDGTGPCAPRRRAARPRDQLLAARAAARMAERAFRVTASPSPTSTGR